MQNSITQKSFENNVDRTSATAKFMGLVSHSDYFLFEMLVNRQMTKNSKLTHFLADIDYGFFEWINFVIIIAHNLLLVKKTYKSEDLEGDDYNYANLDDWNKFE